MSFAATVAELRRDLQNLREEKQHLVARIQSLNDQKDPLIARRDAINAKIDEIQAAIALLEAQP